MSEDMRGRSGQGHISMTRILVVLGLMHLIGILWLIPLGWTATPSTTSPLSPEHQHAAGFQAFQRGELKEAIIQWHKAAQGYARLQQPRAHSIALTHLAHTYEELGHHRQAMYTLEEALKHAEQAADRRQVAVILGDLGAVSAMLGAEDEADRLVRDALALARELGDTGLIASILYIRGNLLMLHQKAHEAISAYRESGTLAQETQNAGAAARALASAAVAAERNQQAQMALTLLDMARRHLHQVRPSHDKVSELLLMGRAYHRLAESNPPLILHAADVLREAADIAQALKDHRSLSYAWGYLGQLYEEEPRYPEALTLTHRAVLAAQQADVPESLYLWQWQSGRLLQATGREQAALDAYERAIETVQSVRTALFHGQRRLQASFRETLGPLYFEYANLLLQKAAALEEKQQEAVYPQYDMYLHRARAAVEQFKTQELRDYFGDECVDAAHQRAVTIDHVSPDAVILYPILLPDRTELLVSLPSGLKRAVIPVKGVDLERRVRIFRNALDALDPRRYLRHAQRLYAWLIQPLEADLQAWNIRTIVFVPDGALRLLPLAALHDGRRFLVERYATSVTPSLTLTEPQTLRPAKLQVLAAGLTEAVEAFPALPHIAEEVRNIQQLYDATVLLNEAFGPERLEQTVQQGDFGIVHIAAHGHFASKAEESFLMTSQGKLTFEQLAQIVGRLRFRQQPLELLTLSACETAQGDDRAALGLAGVAIQAGARSALATLWQVKDAAATQLMTSFYRHLQDPKISRAQALQQAQLELIQDARYANPYFWAPFLLINNWL